MRQPRGKIPGWAAVVGLAALFWPGVAHANVGTALMWAPAFHLLFGNVIIGVGEGLALGFLFRVGKWKAIGIMIAANFASMILGVYIMPPLGVMVETALEPEPLLYTLPRYLVILGGLTFLATVAMEWPFCFWLVVRKPRAVWKSIGAILLVHAVSYAVLTHYYLSLSRISLYTNVEVSRDLVPSLPAIAEIYYIDATGHDLYRITLNGSERTRLSAVNLQGSDDILELSASLDAETRQYRLSAVVQGDSGLEGCPLGAAPIPASARRIDADFDGHYHPWRLRARDLRPEGQRAWSVITEYWAGQGLSARKDDSLLHVALEVPTRMEWFARNATVLPGDLVVYQLGDTIVVLDLERRKLGLLAEGRCPLVALREPTPRDATPTEAVDKTP